MSDAVLGSLSDIGEPVQGPTSSPTYGTAQISPRGGLPARLAGSAPPRPRRCAACAASAGCACGGFPHGRHDDGPRRWGIMPAAERRAMDNPMTAQSAMPAEAGPSKPRDPVQPTVHMLADAASDGPLRWSVPVSSLPSSCRRRPAPTWQASDTRAPDLRRTHVGGRCEWRQARSTPGQSNCRCPPCPLHRPPTPAPVPLGADGIPPAGGR